MPVETAADRLALFAAEEFAETAIYTPADGVDPVAVTIILDRGRAVKRFDGGRFDAVGAERRAWINADEVALVEEGATLEIDADGERLRVCAEPKLDETGVLWAVELVIVGN